MKNGSGLFAGSADVLDALAEDALEDYRRGKTEEYARAKNAAP